MLAKDLLARYHESTAEAIAEEMGYEDVRDWASDHAYAQCQECDKYVHFDFASSEDGGGTWICDRCESKAHQPL